MFTEMNRTSVLLVFTLSLLSSIVMGQITLQGKWRPTGKRSFLPSDEASSSFPSGESSLLFLLQAPTNKNVSGLSLRPQVSDGVGLILLSSHLLFSLSSFFSAFLLRFILQDLDQPEKQQQQRSRMIWQLLMPPDMKQKREKAPKLMK